MKELNQRNAKKRTLDRKDNIALTVMCIPTLVKIILFAYVPLIWIYMAFVKYMPNRGVFASEFIGLKNFEFFFRSLDFTRIFRNTIIYNLLFIFLGLFAALVLAILVFEIRNRLTLKVFQTAFFLPYFISWILVANIVQALIDSNGMITTLICSLSGEKVNLYTEPDAWWFILVFVNIWKGSGVSAIIYYATLMNCDVSLFEAASIDGANRWQKIIYISIPYLVPMICVNTIMSGANILRSDLGLFLFVPKESGSLRPTTDVIDYYIWRAARRGSNFELATAVGLVQGLVGLVLTLIANKIVRSIDANAALY